MNTLFDDLRESWSNPSTRHAMVVHFPIVLAILGVLVAFVAALASRRESRRRGLRLLLVCWYVALAAGSYYTLNSGESAEGNMPPNLDEAIHARLELHEEMADKLWLFALATAGLSALALIPKRGVQLIGATLGVAGAIACAGWTSATAHHGGTLVYVHGVGTTALTELQSERERADVAERRLRELSATRAAGAHAPPTELPSAPVAYFTQSVEPLLAAHCQSCHNNSRPKSGLDLTTAAGLARGGRILGESPVIAGKPEESPLLRIVRGGHSKIERMPPEETLAPEEIAVLERWIREGAAWSATP